MSTATINGLTVPSCRVHLPSYGVWWATVEIDTEVTLTGSVMLAVADLTLVGTIKSGGPFRGKSYYRIAGGAGAWWTDVPRKDYGNDAGVKLKTVITDLARDAGETIGTVADATLGIKYVRCDGPACDALNSMLPKGWYVDEAGVTQLTARPTSTWQGDLTIVDETDVSIGKYVVNSETLAPLVPGISIESKLVVDIEHKLTAGKLRSTLWTADELTNRGVDAVQRLVARLFPQLRYGIPYEYRIVAQEGERLNLQAVRSGLGMPDLRRVKVRPGMAGMRATHQEGATCIVQFIEGDRTRPYVAAFEDAEGLFSPKYLDLGAATGTDFLPRATATQTAIDNIVQRLNLCLAVLFTAQPPATPTPVMTAPIIPGTNSPLLTQSVNPTTKTRAS